MINRLIIPKVRPPVTMALIVRTPTIQPAASTIKGVIQIIYHYNAPLPTTAAGLSEYYAGNGYHVPTAKSDLSSTLSSETLSMSTSASTIRTTASSSTIAITSRTEPTTPSLRFATAFQNKSTTLLSTSAALPPTHQVVSSGLSSSIKAGVGVGVPVGISTVGLLLYFSMRQLRRRSRRNQAYASTLTDAEVTPPGSRRYDNLS